MRWHRLALLLALAGCTGEAGCSLGCSSMLVVQLPAGTTAGQACVAGVCTTDVVDGSLRVPLSRSAEGDTAVVTVTLPDQPVYEGEVPVTRTGSDDDPCAPVCVNGTARVDTASRTVVPADAAASPS